MALKCISNHPSGLWSVQSRVRLVLVLSCDFVLSDQQMACSSQSEILLTSRRAYSLEMVETSKSISTCSPSTLEWSEAGFDIVLSMRATTIRQMFRVNKLHQVQRVGRRVIAYH
jgi:hypothetical protein